MNIQECFELGYITRPLGLKGEFLIKLDTDHPGNYYNLEYAFFQMNPGDEELVPFFFERCSAHKTHLIRVSCEGINSIEDAEKFRGKKVFLPISMLPKKKDKDFYFHEVIGFTLHDRNHGEFGKVLDILEQPAHAIFVTQKNQKEILIPIQDHVIISVDRQKKIIFLDCPEGLIDLYLNA